MEFHSELVPATERGSRYRSAMQEYLEGFETRVELAADDGARDFAASIHTVELCELSGALHRINAAHVVQAQPSAIAGVRAGQLDWYVVNDGEVCLSTAGTDVRLQSGDMLLLDGAEAFRGQSPGLDLTVVTVPAHLARGARARVGRAIRGLGGFAACVGSLMQAARRQQEPLLAEEMLFIESSIVQAFGRVSGQAGAGTPADAHQRQLEQVRCQALRRIREPGLSAEALAREAGISTRQLQRLFERAGSTFSNWLRERRVERCYQELIAPGAPGRTSIAGIAFRWGFNDLRTFNRAFRHQYGTTPRAVLRAGSAA